MIMFVCLHMRLKPSPAALKNACVNFVHTCMPCEIEDSKKVSEARKASVDF
jgi:hypothetical protein